MKKIIIMMLGILAISMFLIGCSQENIEVVDENGNIVGEAFRTAGKVQLKQPITQKQTCADLGCKLECKSFSNIGITHIACQAQGYDTCAGATLIARVSYNDSSSLFSFPMDCETEYSDDFAESMILENLQIDPTYIAGDKDSMTTCCRIK